jgi:hypothetical protein
MTQIDITYKLPVIQGFVIIPDDNNNLPKLTVAEVLEAFPTAYVVDFSVTEHRKFVAFPAFHSDSHVAEDFYAELRALARTKL